MIFWVEYAEIRAEIVKTWILMQRVASLERCFIRTNWTQHRVSTTTLPPTSPQNHKWWMCGRNPHLLFLRAFFAGSCAYFSSRLSISAARKQLKLSSSPMRTLDSALALFGTRCLLYLTVRFLFGNKFLGEIFCGNLSHSTLCAMRWHRSKLKFYFGSRFALGFSHSASCFWDQFVPFYERNRQKPLLQDLSAAQRSKCSPTSCSTRWFCFLPTGGLAC